MPEVLKAYTGSVWETLLSSDPSGELNCKVWAYQAFDDQDLPAASKRSFRLHAVPESGHPPAYGDKQLFRVYCRMSRIAAVGNHQITWRGVTSRAYNANPPWNTSQFILVYATTVERLIPDPTAAWIDLTTNFPLTRDQPSLRMFAIAGYN